MKATGPEDTSTANLFPKDNALADFPLGHVLHHPMASFVVILYGKGNFSKVFDEGEVFSLLVNI